MTIKKTTHILHEETVYVKRGKRYIACSDPWAATGLRTGHWHVWVRKGCTSMRQFILPDRAAVSGALEEAREAMTDAMHKAEKGIPTSRMMTEREQRAWKAYRLEMGIPDDEPITLRGISLNDLIDAGIKALVERTYDD